MDNRHYIFPVYAIAALTLVVIGLFTSAPFSGFAPDTWWYFLLLALIPTVLGHSMYNYLLKFVRAHLVAVTILGEPIGATVFAALIFKEFPPFTTYIGGVLILGGIFAALYKSSYVEPPAEMA
jgi:drug/metabolite transporter (DMT)-like permease